MASRRETLEEAMRQWRTAERRLHDSDDGHAAQEAEVAHLRDAYQHLYTEHMTEHLDRLHEADDRRSRAVPSTPEFHSATQDTEVIAADIWVQARRGDREASRDGGDTAG